MSGRLEGVARSLSSHRGPGGAMQFAIDERKQSLECLFVAAPPCDQQPGHVTWQVSNGGILPFTTSIARCVRGRLLASGR
jgi:hypothetical protein